MKIDFGRFLLELNGEYFENCLLDHLQEEREYNAQELSLIDAGEVPLEAA